MEYMHMDIMDARDYLLSLPLCEECQPFGDDFAVYKIEGKMFACTAFGRPGIIALKCDPDRAILLRDSFSAITPASHFNKRHWNDIDTESLDDEIVRREISHSYMTVIKKERHSESQKRRAAFHCGKGWNRRHHMS